MTVVCTHLDEERRLAVLRGLSILDTPIEERYERVTRLMLKVTKAPAAGISFLDEDREWFKSLQGCSAAQIPRAASFCNHVITHKRAFVIEDALRDVRLRDNPLVQGPPHIRAYAASALCLDARVRVGAVFVFDTSPRVFDEDCIQFLEDIAATTTRRLLTNSLTRPCTPVEEDTP